MFTVDPLSVIDCDFNNPLIVAFRAVNCFCKFKISPVNPDGV